MGEAERCDAWLDTEDRFVAKIVISYIRTGKTQLEAFDIAGEQIGRTASAVAFRWNSTLRKKYEKEVNAAKKERLRLKRSQGRSTPQPSAVLADIRTLEQRVRVLTERNQWLEKELKAAKEENHELRMDISSLRDFAEILRKMTEEQTKGETKP